MKNIRKKLMAFMLAFAMTFAMVVPAITMYTSTVHAVQVQGGEEDDEDVQTGAAKTEVIIHKLLLENLTGWPKNPAADGTIEGLDKQKYNGGKINNIEGYFGTGAKHLKGVYFKYWVVTDEQYDEMTKSPANYDTEAEVKAYLNNQVGTEIGPTTADEAGLSVELDNNKNYWFIESRTALADGATISGMAAVPFGLKLPVYKADGSIFATGNDALHVYPKNTTSQQPTVEKNFADANGEKIKEKDKSFTVGDEVPYVIDTVIKTGTKYKTARWSDQMTEGLTFTEEEMNALTVKIVAPEARKSDLTKDTHFTIKKVDNGFKLELNAEGLKLINDQTTETHIRINYKATLNEKAKVDIPESNDVTFNYGNNPDHGNTPVPNTPKDDGSLTVTKTFDGGNFPDNTSVEITLYNAKTGEVATFQDNQQAKVTLNNGKTTYTWTGLDKNIEYKVVETHVDGYSAEYKKGNAGELSVVNHKDDNPDPIKPEEPKVYTGGHRFQKIDGKDKHGLQGAIFYVKNADNKYLAKKTGTQADQDQTDYVAAEKAYREAVKTNAGDIADKKLARDKAYIAVNTQWTWKDTTTGAYEVTSGEDGYFKITGLAYGTYKLEEKTPPTGYAKLTKEEKFTVKQGSTKETTYAGKTFTDEYMIQVNNIKITIPQTGGIGTVIFVVVGLAIMGGAIFAMKKRNAEER